MNNGFMKYLIHRLIVHSIKIILLLFAVSVVAFFLVSASPTDPIQQYILNFATVVSPEQRAEIERYWGINNQPFERYFNWLMGIVQGNLGESYIYRRPVAEIIAERFCNSLALMLSAWTLSGIVGFGLGCLMGMREDTLTDKSLKTVCYILGSVPLFWVGLLALLIFSVWLNWFPMGFSSPIGILSKDVTLAQKIHHLILPALTLGLVSYGNIALHTRQKLIDILNSDYVLFAKARGEDELTIFKRHILKNILFPALTLQFASLSELFGGSVIAETIFSYPGLGSAISIAGLNGDVPLLLGITLFSALFVAIGNMIADIFYIIIDPRIREEGSYEI